MFKNHDYIITISTFLLSILSMVLIFSTTYNAESAESGAGTFRKQIIFFIVGFLIYFALSTLDLDWLQNRKILFLIYFITISLLIYVKFFTDPIANTNRWITVLGFNIQPAEYAKISLVIITSAILSYHQEEFLKFFKWNDKKKKDTTSQTKINRALKIIHKKLPNLHKYLLGFVISLPIVYLVFIQPALGNSIIILALFAAMAFAFSSGQLKILNFIFPLVIIPLSQWNVINIDQDVAVIIAIIGTLLLTLYSRLKWYLILLALALAFTIRPTILTLWESPLLDDYQKERVETFFDSPDKDPLDAGYQVRQSKIAIGAGRLFGRGYLQGTQSNLQVLPFAHTDFIFASLGEQFGLIGALLLIAIYLVLLIRILITATDVKNEFSFLLGIGFATMFLLNIFINIGMNLGKLPVTGVPLPLVSYGGSSVIVNLTGLGLVQATRKNMKLKDISESLLPRNHSRSRN